MSRIVDNLLAFKILKMLVTNFEDTDAYKLGIIDNKGKNLRKATSLKTTKEKDSYSYLHRLVFNMKKLINKLPGGEAKTKSMVAALFLVKEYYQQGSRVTSTAILSEKLDRVLEVLGTGAILVEEETAVRKFYEQLEEDAPTNATGAAVSTDQPVIKKKDVSKYLAKREPLKSFANSR